MKALLILFLILTSVGMNAFAQGEPTPESTSIWSDPNLMFYMVVALVFMVAILVLLVALYMLQVINHMTHQAAKEKAEKLGIIYKPEPGIWEKLWQQSNDFTPLEKEGDILLSHNYDGIRELDNHLPPWWTGLFYGTIVFSVVYLLFFHVFDTLPLSSQEYEREVVAAEQQMQKFKAANPAPAIDESNVEITTDAQALADGKQVFLNNCASCHRRDGGGDIGPNLTDEYWLHGGDIQSIFKTVRHGVTGTNMIAWEGFISPEKMKNVSSYILTLQGTNPENPKRPQGEMYKKPTQEVKADSVKTQAGL